MPRAETLSPRRSSNAKSIHRELADEAIVIVKRLAEEDMVTYQRIKLIESAKESGDEGRNILR